MQACMSCLRLSISRPRSLLLHGALILILFSGSLDDASAQPPASEGEAGAPTDQQGDPSALMGALDKLRAADAKAASTTSKSSNQGAKKDVPAARGDGDKTEMKAPLPAVYAQDCSQVDGGVSNIELADKADIVVSGIALAAGPGTGTCHSNGTLSPAVADVVKGAFNTSFVVLGLQCVHKGIVKCRGNPEDTGDCLILVELPVRDDAPPCALSQGARYMFFLQKAPEGCDGFYMAMYNLAYHTIRPPLGGTGCAFYPCFPPADDFVNQVQGQCGSKGLPASSKCEADTCSPVLTRSPCANDTAVSCAQKTCPGKFMYFNAILPQETCYELYSYKTSGLPVNCYGQRYINNRIAQLAAAQAQREAMVNATATAGDEGKKAEEKVVKQEEKKEAEKLEKPKPAAKESRKVKGSKTG